MSLSIAVKKTLGDFHLDVSLDMEGGITGILGPSGCGKSMTLMSIAGIVRPDSGRVELEGRTLFDPSRGIDLSPQQRRVGYLFQDYALFPNMTVRQNILCGLHRVKEKQKRETRLDEIIGIMQLEELENRRPSQLSGGQKQRVALARILVGDPDLLVLDEPFSALDSFLREQLQIETLKLLKSFGKPALLVTHNVSEAYRLCDHIALLDDGKPVAYKPSCELFSTPGSSRAAFLTGCRNIAAAEKAGEHSVSVPGWGVKLATAEPVGEGVCAVGVREQNFGPGIQENRFTVDFEDCIEDPFEYCLQFGFSGKPGASSGIWWRTPKEATAAQKPKELGVAPENVMLFYS